MGANLWPRCLRRLFASLKDPQSLLWIQTTQEKKLSSGFWETVASGPVFGKHEVEGFPGGARASKPGRQKVLDATLLHTGPSQDGCCSFNQGQPGSKCWGLGCVPHTTPSAPSSCLPVGKVCWSLGATENCSSQPHSDPRIRLCAFTGFPGTLCMGAGEQNRQLWDCCPPSKSAPCRPITTILSRHLCRKREGFKPGWTTLNSVEQDLLKGSGTL